MAVTNLTGTKWQFNETLTSDLSQSSFAIYGRIYNNLYEIILTHAQGETPHTIRGNKVTGGYYAGVFTDAGAWTYPAFRINNFGESRNWSYRETSKSTYSYTPAPILEIDSGSSADLTSSVLINWLETNATLVYPLPADITLDLSTIGLPAGSHSIQMKLSDDGLTKADSELSNTVTYVGPEQLPAPTNLTADGTTVSWDEVENATSYAVLADGNEIGTVEAETGYTLTITNNTGVKISTGNIESLNISSISPIEEIANGETKTFLINFAEENASETYIYFYGFSFYVDNGSTYSGVGISSVDGTGGGGHPTIYFTNPVILNGSGQVMFNGYDD